MTMIDRILARASGVTLTATMVVAANAPSPPIAAAPPVVTMPSPVKVPRRAQKASDAEWLWSLDAPLLKLSPVDSFTVRDAYPGEHIFAANGSGKTSVSGKAFSKA